MLLPSAKFRLGEAPGLGQAIKIKDRVPALARKPQSNSRGPVEAFG